MQRISVIQPTTITVEIFIRQEDNINQSSIWTVFRKIIIFNIMKHSSRNTKESLIRP